MTARPLPLRVFLDEGVPDSVGRAFSNSGAEVIYLREAGVPGSPDQLVCALSEANNAVLVALDGDMRHIARRQGIGQQRFRRLSLIKLCCRETRAAERVEAAMSLIKHELTHAINATDRRIFIEIGDNFIRTIR